MFALGLPEILIILIAVTVIAFEVAMFVHMIYNKQLNSSSKIIWLAAFIFFQVFTAAYYYATAYTGAYALRKTGA
jgi:heme/copper-type cytochrome/quinol oxidase subunit 4